MNRTLIEEWADGRRLEMRIRVSTDELFVADFSIDQRVLVTVTWRAGAALPPYDIDRELPVHVTIAAKRLPPTAVYTAADYAILLNAAVGLGDRLETDGIAAATRPDQPWGVGPYAVQ